MRADFSVGGFLPREQASNLKCIARWVAQAVRLNRESLATDERVSASPTLPRWFLNQPLTDSLFGCTNIYFLQCCSRGGKPSEKLSWLTLDLVTGGGGHR
jgi:hypothetical protein